MFVIFGVASAVWLLPWLQLVRMLPSEAAHRQARFPVKKLLGRGSLWAIGVGHACSNYGFYFLIAFLPLYLVQQRGLTILQMSMLATLGFSIQAVSALAFGIASDRWTRAGRSEAFIRRWMMVASHLIYGCCIIAVPLAHSLVTVAVLLCILGGCGGAMALNIYALAQMFAGPRASGTWVGIQNAFGNVSGVVGPAISGMIIDRAGYGSAFGLASAISLFGSLWWLFGVPRIGQVQLD